jgi:hypothetical protein
MLGGLLVFSGTLRVADATARQRLVAAPEAPAPGYTPRFVTQTDERPPWEDCLWASGVMLLDKWTHGRLTPDRQALRRSSGDRVGGSRFADLARAISRHYGWRPKFSPGGGERLTWTGLLERLTIGGGAVIEGDYGRLGAPYTRWGRAYARDRNAAGHALYVERYDAAHKRIWLMDPLGHDGYAGEWVPATRVHNFIWKRNGLVYAMPTAAPPPRSVTGYVPGDLTLLAGSHRAGDLVPASLPLLEEGPWELPNLVLVSRWELVAPDVLAVPELAALAANKHARAVVRRAPLHAHIAEAAPAFAPAGGATQPVPPPSMSLQTWVAMPDEPGLYRLAASVERGDGKAMPKSWQLPTSDVRVWGERGAVVLPTAPAAPAAAGQSVQLTVSVEDAGTLPWTYDEVGPDLGDDDLTTLTQLEAAWVDASGRSTPAMVPLLLGSASGQAQAVSLTLAAPTLPGDYTLVFDVRDGAGSLLGPEDSAHALALVVGPAPLPSLAPTQNQ